MLSFFTVQNVIIFGAVHVIISHGVNVIIFEALHVHVIISHGVNVIICVALDVIIFHSSECYHF